MSIPLSDSTTFVRDEMGGPGENGQTPPDDEDQGIVYVQGSGDVTVTVEKAEKQGFLLLLIYAVCKRGLLCDEVQ